ncbi:MAG TPA: hypothetical protein VGC21_05365 [Telluria sp.]|jgi:hypothetical protein
MKLFRFLTLLALVALPALADAPLRIVKSDKGYLFSSQSNTSGYEFEVPGKTIRSSEKEGRIFAMIDGALVQILRVPAAQGKDEEALAAHRRSESAYLEKSGAVLAESAQCAALAIPHAEWRAELKDVSNSRYLTVKLDDSILVLVVADNATSPPGQAEQQFSAICGSFHR